MNETALAQRRANKRRLGMVHRGRAIPTLRHLSRRFYSPEGFFKAMPDPRPINAIELTTRFMRAISFIGAIPFLRRREKQWRK